MSRKMLITSLLVSSLLPACAMHTVNEVASSLLLKPQAKLSRHRHLSISHLSHIGLYVDKQQVIQDSRYAGDPLLKPRLKELAQGASQAVATTFAQYTHMDKPKSPNRGIDFIIHAQIMELSLTELEEPVALEAVEDEQEPTQILIPTDHLKIKLVLKDARSGQLIDVAYLQSRSGQLEYRKGYAVFAEYSMGQYLKAITQ